MTPVSSPSQKSKDGGGLPARQQKSIRPHPPRLQHSPSLPNIWFPPHSGPIPAQLVNNMSPESFSSSKPQDGDKKSPQSKQSQVSFCEPLSKSRPHVKITAHKLGRRQQQRVETEHHRLLTPPLTPSSSIRTNASVDSSVGPTDSFSGGHSAQVAGGDDDDSCPSRFLLVGNISPDVSQETVKKAVYSLATLKLASYRSDYKLPTPVTPSTMDDIATKIPNGCPRQSLENPIKGLFFTTQGNDPSIFLAFHDLRDAIAAKNYFDSRESDALDECVGEGKDETGKQSLVCNFLTMEQVTTKLGPSAFLRSMDPSFDVIAEDDNTVGEAAQSLKLDDDESTEKSIGRDIVLLRTFLEAYGGIRSFSDTIPQDGHQASNSAYKTFRVEFFDLREATSTYRSLHSPVSVFGMKIRVSGRDDLLENTEHNDPEPVQATPADKPAIVPFPISRAIDDSIQPFGTPGQLSQIREPFSFPFDTTNDDSFGHPPSASSDNRSTGSPPFFYTSENQLRTYVPGDPNNRGRVEGNVLDPQHHQLLQHYYSPSADGYAYPLHDSVSPAPMMRHPYYCSTPTPPPIPYHHGYLSPHFPGAALHGASGGVVPFDQETSMIPSMNIGWPIEMMNGVSPYPSGYSLSTGVSSGHDGFWVQGATPTAFPNSPSSYFTHGPPRLPPNYIIPLPGDQQVVPVTPSSIQEVSPRQNVSPSPSPPHLPGNSSGSPHGSTTRKETSEHNQLNLIRIEEGVDTRTTIMIKNIPNKMTDKDLMAYIGKVCPRRIDFLYLRMDFKNGCNVGYAFVNFISVQDLLEFAKKRLGQKWNMFSSEKVLQMSYANYQGKEALVEKFKNSCIMDEREAWQPKIFYSEPGPEQGLPEPFPVATHQRRKERSSHNRGALYVPGNSTLQNQNILHPLSSSRRLEYNDSRYRERTHRRQRTTTTGD